MWMLRKKDKKMNFMRKICSIECIYVSMYLCIYVSMYLCIYVSMYLCIYVSMYLCIYVDMLAHIPLPLSKFPVSYNWND
jgi:hypothetical protein